MFILIFFSPVLSLSQKSYFTNNDVESSLTFNSNISNSENFIWPLPGFTKISSHFGLRASPTLHASSFHKGLDIPAPPGTKIFSVISGTVIMAKFNGSGGCTIVITNGNISVTYCHVSPTFIVYTGQQVHKGDLISYVGTKNIYGFLDNTYFDSTGNPTNGATTGPHLHLTIKKIILQLTL